MDMGRFMCGFWPSSLVDWAQIAAAIGTCGAVIVSLILANRGIQTKLETSCVVLRGIGDPRLKVVYRNVGRDTIYLVGIGGTAADGSELRERFITVEGHFVLPPSAPDTTIMEKHNTVTRPADGLPKQFVRLWLEDVSGKRFHVRNSDKCLGELWSEMREEPAAPIVRRDFPQ
ncbi:hypothetical protein LJR034_000831 [Caballeronia sp. LjRoot34]|uniref:hypothetical protein n=1 Tax=Caballeronia sp. LjRoot34 TaxID=3342325 RepID=UPI003ECE5630